MDFPELRKNVLKRPGMYLGDFNSSDAANKVVKELLANSINQYLLGRVQKY